MRHYCTYFDHNYLPRGLALYRSLKLQGGEFRLWVLCLSAACRERLQSLALPGLETISLEEFEAGDSPLLAARENRSRIEYYFTCTPSLPLFIFRKSPAVGSITYLDGDLYFFGDPELAHAEAAGHSIAITPHRFPAALRDRERYGIFNVGWLTFRRDENALACLNWWRERCLEWCQDRCEPSRFADQKYLDDWPARFAGVKVLDHPGINLAPWNISNHRLRLEGGRILVDDRPLIFYHFHALKHLSGRVFDPQWSVYKVRHTRLIRREIYRPYLESLGREQGPPMESLRTTMNEAGRPPGLAGGWKLWRGVLKGKYLKAPQPT